MPEHTDREYEKLHQSSLKELEIFIGNKIVSDMLGSKPASDEEKARFFRTWFNNRKQEITNRICSDDFLKKHFIKQEAHEFYQIVTPIADLIVGIVGGLPAVTVAAYCIKFGLKNLCGNCSND